MKTIKVLLYKIEWTGRWELADGTPREIINRVLVREEVFGGPTTDKAKRAWLRSDSYRNHGSLDWEYSDEVTA